MLSRILRTIVPVAACLVLVACASTPRHQGLTSEELYALGQREFEEGDLGDAAETLETLLITFPQFRQAAEAQMLLARAYFEDKKYVTAQAEFRRVLDRYPGHAQAPQAALGMCRSAEALSPITQRDQTFTREAFQVCLQAARDYAGTPEADQAGEVAEVMRDKLARDDYETGKYYLDRGFHHSAIIYFDVILDQHAATDWAPTALAGLIEAYTELGYDDEVASARQRLLRDYPDSPEAQRVANDRGEPSSARVGTGP